MTRALPPSSFIAARLRGPSRWKRLALVALMWGGVQAHAGLFEDDEARRAITELRTQRTQDLEAAKTDAA
ncbi:MAG: hypothetical protein RI920_1930, partial [Pseudomonadota bacterium]